MLLTVLGWLGLFIGGLSLGLLLVLLIKVKQTNKAIEKNLAKRKSHYKFDKQDVDKIVKKQRRAYKKKNRFHVVKKVAGLKVKTKGYFTMYGDIINEVAKLQKPDSQKPFLEFTVKQAFDFIDQITVDLEEILNSLSLPMLKNMDVSTVFAIVDIGNKIAGLRVVKGVKRVAKPFKPFVNLFKLINPVKWVTMAINVIFTANLTRSLLFAFADIVALEFAEFYAQCKNENAVIAG